MRLLFLGDFLYDYEEINQDILDLGDYFKSRDISIILNCEGSLNVAGSLKKNVVLFHNENRIGEILQTLNTKAVCLANNHIMDGQEQGLRRLLEILDRCKIGYFGAGTDLPKALRPLIIEDEKHQKIGLLGFGWNVEKCVYATAESAGVAPLTEKIVMSAIKQVRKEVDFLIVVPHWGYSFELYPLPIHRRLAQEMITAGADMIIGHHPHIIQAFEKIQDKLVYYSIGNFYVGTQRDSKRRKFSNPNVNPELGQGILLDTSNLEIDSIFIEYTKQKSTLSSQKKISIDISAFDINTYNQQYPSLRTTHIKPPLLYHRWSWIINPIKILGYESWSTIITQVIKVISFLNIYQAAKKIPFLRRFSYVVRGSSKMFKDDR